MDILSHTIQSLLNKLESQRRLLSAYHELELAVRRMGLPSVISTGERQFTELNNALKNIEEARRDT